MRRGDRVAILASGPSMNARIVDEVQRAGLRMIAINTTYRLAPDADALFAADWEWWNAHPEALSFAGRKLVGRACELQSVECVRPHEIRSGDSSALRAAQWAEDEGADSIFLFGVDLNDEAPTHWHGAHPVGLNNPTPESFHAQRLAWLHYASQARADVINCNPASGLRCFPRRALADVLEMA